MTSISRLCCLLCVHSLVVALYQVLTVHALYRSLDSNTQHVETIYIRNEGYTHRTRRSTRENPDEFRLSFTALNQPIKLRLKRHAQTTNLPVFTLHNGRAVEKRIRKTPEINFYHDKTFGATFFYTRNHNSSRPFDLDGSMFINGFEYIITPDHLVTWVGGDGAAHALKRLNSRLSYGLDGIDTRDPYTRFASQRRTTRYRDKRLQRRNQRVPGFPGSRRRRQSIEPSTHYIELSIVADYAVWKRFLEYASGDQDMAFKELQHYYLFVAVMMDVRYKSVTEVDSTLKIRIVPVSLIVTDDPNEAVWIENYRVGRSFVQAINSLYALREWVRRGNGVPRADHTMLFSGYDLLGSQSDSSTIGVAFIGTACTYNSVSVIEEYFTGTSGTVSAHELGHSLDAEHDANYGACSDLSANVMSTQAVFPTDVDKVSNPWKFSTCSVDAIGAFLETAGCTKEEPETFIKTSQTGGVYFSADEQCRLVMGQESYFCRSVQARKGFGKMCRHLYCYLPEEPGYCGSIIASEYTTCGDGKWCEKGVCVADSSAPASSSDTCPQGDEPGYQCRPEDCGDRKVKEVYCCHTCAHRNESTNVKQDKQSLNDAPDSLTATGSLETPGVSPSPTVAMRLPTTKAEVAFNTKEITSVTPKLSSITVTTSAVNLNTSPSTFNESTSQSTRPFNSSTSTTATTTTTSPTTTVFDVQNTAVVTLVSSPVSGQGEKKLFTTLPSSTATSASEILSTISSTKSTTPSVTSTPLHTKTTPPFDFNNTDIITLSTASKCADRCGQQSTTESSIAPTPNRLCGQQSTTESSIAPSPNRPCGQQSTTESSIAPSPNRPPIVTASSTILTTLLRNDDKTNSGPPSTVSPTPGFVSDNIVESSEITTALSTSPFGKNSKIQDDISSTALTMVFPTSSPKTSRQQRTSTLKTIRLSTTSAFTTKSSTSSFEKLLLSSPTPFILNKTPTPLEITKTPATTITTTTTTTTAKRITTLAPCDSIYCLCKRCYSCYTNVCRMFVPGGFYYNFIYG